MTSGNLKNIYDIHDEYPERTANSDSSKINLLDVLTNGSRWQRKIKLAQLEAERKLMTLLHFGR